MMVQADNLLVNVVICRQRGRLSEPQPQLYATEVCIFLTLVNFQINSLCKLYSPILTNIANANYTASMDVTNMYARSKINLHLDHDLVWSTYVYTNIPKCQ